MDLIYGLNEAESDPGRPRRLGPLQEAEIGQPSTLAAGADGIVRVHREAFHRLKQTMPNPREKPLVAGASRWVQQVQPEAANRLLIDFLPEPDAACLYGQMTRLNCPRVFRLGAAGL